MVNNPVMEAATVYRTGCSLWNYYGKSAWLLTPLCSVLSVSCWFPRDGGEGKLRDRQSAGKWFQDGMLRRKHTGLYLRFNEQTHQGIRRCLCTCWRANNIRFSILSKCLAKLSLKSKTYILSYIFKTVFMNTNKLKYDCRSIRCNKYRSKL